MPRLRSVSLLSLLLPPLLPAQESIPFPEREEIVEFLGPTLAADGRHGVVVGILMHEEKRVYGFGRASASAEGEMTGNSILEIGSLSKVFTGLALAMLAEEGLVEIDEPIRNILPDSVDLPDSEDKPIRLVHLSTHRSGLPRLPGNLKMTRPDNPYADYTVDDLYAYLSRMDLQREVGSGHEYSNLAVGLLGHCLSLRAQQSYEEIIRQRICLPLGMEDTMISPSEDQAERMVIGHDARGKATAYWDLPTLAGAGALRSSMDDLLRFMAACCQPPDEAFAKALALSQEPRERVGPDFWIGLGWFRSGKSEDIMIWHNGATGGFCSFFGYRPAVKTGVIVLSNRAMGGGAPEPQEIAGRIKGLLR